MTEDEPPLGRREMNTPPLGRREMNKALRRSAILGAARDLLREFEIDKITVEQVADRADVSPATVYNLVGTREAVFGALMQELLASLATELDGLSAEDPIGYAEAIVTRSVDRFVDDPLVHRELIGLLMSSRRDPVQHEAGVDAAYLQVEAIQAAQAAGLVDPDVDPEVIGLQILLSYDGAMIDWARGRLDDDGFKLYALQGLYATLVAVATETSVADLRSRLNRIHEQLRGNAPLGRPILGRG